jgi:DHA1 family multidrug resistance protein-like MFS transporter
MIKRFLSRFIRPRHYWRDLGFDELSELYTSMMFRSLAMSLVGIFIPIYLYTLDYPVWQIFLFYAVMFAVWSLICYPVARLIAKVGPKHTMLASYVSQVISMLLLVSQDELRWPLAVIAAALAVSNCMFFSAFHVDFSKVKHKEHGGKELGWMMSMEKVGAVAGPLIGGLVALWFGPQYIFIAAIALLFVGIFPLFLTREPTATNQKLNFKDLHIKDIKSDLIAVQFFHIENAITINAWPLFLGIYIFSDSPYIKLGSIVSISVLISLVAARAIGRTIDRRKGRPLLRYSAVFNAALHLFRPFANSYPYALGVNLLNEAVTPAYRMPFFKGLYDAADDLPGRRIVYITVIEATGTATKAACFLLAGMIAYFTPDSKSVFTVMFAIAAVASLGIMLEKFKALKP